MKPTTNIKLTKDEAKLLLRILGDAMTYPTNRPGNVAVDDIKRISNKVWAEMVVIQDMGA